MTDTIERETLINAPVARVWNAVGDHRRFGEWFRVALDQPFVAGEKSTGHIAHKGYEHVRWTADVVAVEPPSRLALRWHPYAIDQDRDYSEEPTTLVEILLAPEGDATRLRVVESGFDALPAGRRDEAFQMNSSGWEQQMANVRTYVEG
jgi:uncharacterized protein YndB with AHSA1/START domain